MLMIWKANPNKKFIAAMTYVFVLLMPALSYALSLGSIKVKSFLGQPLKAEIPLQASSEELKSLQVLMATPSEFSKTGVEYGPAVRDIRVELKTSGGQKYIELKTIDPVTQSYVEVLLNLTWSSGKLFRDFVFLLDPPDFNSQELQAPLLDEPLMSEEVLNDDALSSSDDLFLEGVSSGNGVREILIEKKIVLPGELDQRMARRPYMRLGGRYKVVRGDTLTKIARKFKGSGVSVEQMIVGIYEINRQNKKTFIEDNLHLVLEGAVIDIPDEPSVRKISSKEARRRIRSQVSGFNDFKARLGVLSPGMMPSSNSAQASGVINQGMAGGSKQGDQLVLSNKGMSQDIAVAAVSRNKALSEVNNTLSEIERNVSDLERIASGQSLPPGGLPQQITPPSFSGNQPVAPPPALNEQPVSNGQAPVNAVPAGITPLDLQASSGGNIPSFLEPFVSVLDITPVGPMVRDNPIILYAILVILAVIVLLVLKAALGGNRKNKR